jgi:hypothetical protein
VLGGMERWIWRLYKDGMFLHIFVFCWGVLGMYLGQHGWWEFLE